MDFSNIKNSCDVWQLLIPIWQLFTLKSWISLLLSTMHIFVFSHQKHVFDVIEFWHVSMELCFGLYQIKRIRWFHFKLSEKNEVNNRTRHYKSIIQRWFRISVTISFTGNLSSHCAMQNSAHFQCLMVVQFLPVISVLWLKYD